jgi:hypothetical protein
MGQSLPLRTKITTATTNNNILTGTAIEFQGKAAVLTIYGNADAVDLTHTFYANDGQQTISPIPPNSALKVASTAGAVKTNEDFLIQIPIPAGMRLVHAVTNPTGADVSVTFLYVIT